VDVDPHRWESGQHTFSATVSLLADLSPGEYILALWLPDPADALRNDPRYAIRFANENIWDATSGWDVRNKWSALRALKILALLRHVPKPIADCQPSPTPTADWHGHAQASSASRNFWRKKEGLTLVWVFSQRG
jgi:hypothetical protein